jgi:DNA-binding NarL/FixJ family response regulator
VRAALEAGATACCLAAAPRGQLVRAIKATSLGATWLDREISEALFRDARPRSSEVFRLTAKERAVLQLITEGYSNVKIAAELQCSSGTIHTHVDHLFRKLGVNDRVSAAVYALRQGLISDTASSPRVGQTVKCERTASDNRQTA